MLSIPSILFTKGSSNALYPPESLKKDPSMAKQASDSQRPDKPL